MPKTLEPVVSEAPAPTVLGLELNIDYAALQSPADRASLSGYYGRCLEFEGRWVVLQDQRMTLLTNGIDRTIRELRETGETLRAAADELEAEAYELFAERKQTAQQLLPAMMAYVDRCEREYEAAIDAEQARLAAEGVDFTCMPAAASNPVEATRAFRKVHLENSTPALRARGVLMKAKGMLEATKSNAEFEPARGPGRVQCEWPRIKGNPDMELAAQLSGLVQRGGPTQLAYDQNGYLR